MGDAKHRARAAVLAARRGLPAEALATAAARVQSTLIALVRREDWSTIAGYAPIGREPGGADLPEVLAAALGPDGRLLLPVLRPDLDLEWSRYSPQAMTVTERGLHEPSGPTEGLTGVAAAALVVVPALAVDRSGIRLGRGGGSYDRALARVPADALVVALLHDGELVEALPAAPHDRRVDAVVTPRDGLLRFPAPLPLD